MAKLTNDLMIQELSEDFVNVTVQMEDCHAYYFDAVDPDTQKVVEVKVVKDDSELEFFDGESKSYAVYYREEGTEDWYLVSHIELEFEAA